LAKDPGNARALHLLGNLCFRTGRAREALVLLERAVAVAAPSDVTEVRNGYAAVLGALGRLREAADLLRQVIAAAPGHARAHNNLGVTLERAGRFAEAAEAFCQAAAFEPGNAVFATHLGTVLRKAGRPDEAEAAFRQAIGRDACHAPAHEGLAVVLRETTRHAEAITASRAAVTLRPGDPALHSSLLYEMHYATEVGPDELFAEHVAWARRHAAPLLGPVQTYDNDRTPGRRLRVGYVSPDFRRHSVATFAEPLLAAHDRDQVHVTCYSAARRTDAVTERIRATADVWRDIARASDADAAALIRADRIDVLVDLTGHMGDNRLLVFARRPAPVQVTYVGHPDTTGMAAIDYRMTDPFLDPPEGGSDARHSEALVRLPRIFGCYRPPDEVIEVAAPPCIANGFVTFGCLNNPAKITREALFTWARILHTIPGSRLTLLGESSTRVRAAFEESGVEPARVTWLGRLSRSDYLAAFNGIDVALDPFPYNGQTTTCDAFWMGVPVVALTGNAYVSRMGACLLRHVGLDDFAADGVDGYVSAADSLSADRQRLTELRSTLRHVLLGSSICDGPTLAREVEQVYRQIWASWCATRDAP
jgi:predicted O-linked N-acetylglucosamine transferase (SPINDLY family)